MNTFYRYSYVQHIYDEAEIDAFSGDEITAIAFKYISTAPETKGPITIYVGPTTKTTFSSTTNWEPIGNLTQVYSGSLTLNNSQTWFNIDFDVPYEYTGGNLVVAILNNHGNYVDSRTTFSTHATTGNKTLHYRVDGTTPINPASPPTATGMLSERSNTRFIVCPGIVYNVYQDDDPVPVATTGNPFYVATGLVIWDAHTWCVTVMCPQGESLPACVTLPGCYGDCEPPYNLTAYYTGVECHAQLNWDPPMGDKGTTAPIPSETEYTYISREGGDGTATILSRSYNEKPLTSGDDPDAPNDWIKWCGTNYDAIGTGGSVDFIIVTRYTPTDMATFSVFNGDLIPSIRFIPSQLNCISSVTLHIYQGGAYPGSSGSLLYQQPITQALVADVYNVVNLTTPFIIDASQELWVGIKFVNVCGYTAGCDSGPRVQGKGNIIEWQGSWTTMYDLNPDLVYNWNLETFVETGNPNLAAAPDPFTLTPVGTSLRAKLVWKNPTQTVGGTPLTSINKIVVERDGTPIQEFTSVTTGQNMTYTDNTIPSPGPYCYSVYAVTSEGIGAKASDCDIFGDVCNAQVIITSVTYGDDFSWKITDDNSGAMLMGGGTQAGGSNVSAGTFSALLTGNATFLLWQHGTYFDNGISLTIHVDGVLIHSLTISDIPAGYTNTAEMICESNAILYNIYRDGTIIMPDWPENEYLDTTLDPLFGHEWCIKVACNPLGESMPTCASLPACGICEPIQDLVAIQPKEGVVQFNWTVPLDSILPGYVGMRVIRDGAIVAACLNKPIDTYTDQVSVGLHNYCFIALYDKPECVESAQMCWTIDVYEQCDPVENLTATVIGADKVRVQWTSVTALAFVEYEVYRGGTLVGTVTQALFIDEGVPQGPHTYSVITKYSKSCTESAEVFSNQIVIESCAEVTNLQVTKATPTEIIITWAHPDAASFDVYRDAIFLDNVTTLTYTDAGTFKEGVVYKYCVIPVYETCQVTPACVDALITPCVPDNVTNVAVAGDPDKKEAVITWDYAGTGATFDVFRNNKLIANVAVKTYTDTNIEYDVVYKYCVTPVYPACPGGGSACNTVVITDIGEVTAGLYIYPNPANNYVSIDGKIVVQVDIYNAIGQMVTTIKSTDIKDSFKVDVSTYEPGAYIFKIHTSDNATVTKPIVITRY
jgi:hypothetical protein